MDPHLQKKILRQQLEEYVNNDNLQSAQTLMEHILISYANDKKYLAELKPIQNIIQLHLSPHRHNRLSESTFTTAPQIKINKPKEENLSSARQELQSLIESTRKKNHAKKALNFYQKEPESIRNSKQRKLRDRQRFIDSCLQDEDVKWTKEEHEQLLAVQKLFVEELKRRHKENRIILVSCCSLILCLILGLCSWLLIQAANRADIRLQQALRSENPSDIKANLDASDRPIYYWLYPSLEKSRADALQWLSHLQDSHQIIYDLEEGKRGIDSLVASDYKALKSLQNAKDSTSQKLQQRWQIFKQSKLNEREQRKVELLTDIVSTLPMVTQLSLIPQEDFKNLQEEKAQLQRILTQLISTQDTHRLPPSYINKPRLRINAINLLLDDIEELRLLSGKLLHAPNYREYLSQLNTLRARSYPLNIQILQLKTQVPPPDQLRQIMRYGQKEEERQALQAAEHSILNDRPTFTTEFPATQEQISAMENIFNSRSLLSPLYQIYTPRDGNIWIAEQAPEIDESGKVRFRRSTFDPYHQLGESRNITLPHDKGMIVNRLDARPLMDRGQLERDKFYNHAHLAQLLTDIVQYNNPRYPILAQAFIFNQILQTLELHPSGYISGLALSPALQGDIQSFRKLVATCGIKLNGQSYLSLSPQHERAAEQFRQWFHAHRGQNYLNDMRRNLRQILLVPANYVGFVNGARQAVLKQEIKEEQQLWYFHQKEEKLTLGTLENIGEAAPFSPILLSVEQSLP